jgi:membrane associated rhomboid family serine protease
MIPLKDNIPSRTVPWISYLIIVVCGVTFADQLLTQAQQGDPIVERLGMIPKRVFHPDEPVVMQEKVAVVDRFGQVLEVREVSRELAAPGFSPWWTMLTCIFLHGGWMHFLGNMWFLYIFGDNVEDRLGHVAFLLFYLFCGVGASLAHLLTNADSSIPTIGASGAIAGVMGAYFLLYPKASVLTLVPIFFFVQIIVVPAPVFLGIWFVLQSLQGMLSVTSVEAGGVAWWAHIGGFALGWLVAAALRRVGETAPPVEQRRTVHRAPEDRMMPRRWT